MLKAFITIVDEDTGRTYVENQPFPPSSITEFEESLCTRYRFSFNFVKVNDALHQYIEMRRKAQPDIRKEEEE